MESWWLQLQLEMTWKTQESCSIEGIGLTVEEKSWAHYVRAKVFNQIMVDTHFDCFVVLKSLFMNLWLQFDIFEHSTEGFEQDSSIFIDSKRQPSLARFCWTEKSIELWSFSVEFQV